MGMRTQNRFAAQNEGNLPSRANSPGKHRNWLNSVFAGVALIAISSLLGVLAYDWYFCCVLDNLSQSFQPIAKALERNVGTP